MKYIGLTQDQRAIVDDEDYDRLMKYKWCAHWEPSTRSYVALRGMGPKKKRKIQYMSRVIMNASPDKQVDHIDHQTLDNRKNNLRLVTNQQNKFNQKPHLDTSSKYKGVSWFKRDKRWRAYICKNRTIHHLGYFKIEKDAALAYDKAAQKMFGEYAYKNF